MTILKDGYPDTAGYTMPGEFEPHTACIMIWPERPGSWKYEAKEARRAFRNVIAAIAQSEMVYVAASSDSLQSALALLFGNAVRPGGAADSWRYSKTAETADADFWKTQVEVFQMETDDSWARDIGPTFLLPRDAKADGSICAVNWNFNAWGGMTDGLYAHWDRDNAFAGAFCDRYGYPFWDASPFVLEGGAICSDGEGTLLVTECCLLSEGRNPSLNREEIETQLLHFLGIEKVLWLPCGIYHDETNGHVDNICAFLKPAEVVLAWTDREEDPQYALSQACLTYLSQMTDARGRKLVIHKLPIPDVPICIEQEDLNGYAFEEGEEQRQVGERLAASYVNFYFSNDAVVLPVFGGPNQSSDRRAISLMQQWNPSRRILPVAARDILTGGGNIHCITQQIPCERDPIVG